MTATANPLANYEAKTTAFMLDGVKYTIKQVRVLFDGVCRKDHWKNPITAKVEAKRARLLSDCIVFFHGGSVDVSEADADGNVTLTNNGYVC